METSINFRAKGFFDFNNSLFTLYDDDSIKFFSKNNFENKITIKESFFKNIEICQKNEGDKIVVFNKSKIFFIQIIDTIEYMIVEQKDFSEYNSLIFNSNLDLMRFYTPNYNKIQILLFPEYSKEKFSHSFSSKFNQFLLINDNLLIGIKNNYIKFFLLKEDNCELLNEYEISINDKDNSAISLNEDFLALYAFKLSRIYLFNKKNYFLSKTINLDFQSEPSISIFKINNIVSIVSLFIREDQMKLVNYDISFNGLKWKEIKTKTILNDKVTFYNQFDRNHILFMGKQKCYLVKIQINKNNN